jgi:hypothetical protein
LQVSEMPSRDVVCDLSGAEGAMSYLNQLRENFLLLQIEFEVFKAPRLLG